MDGVDTGWVKLGKRNYMSFARLLPGSYTLRIIANNINQRQSKEKALQIIIDPPWFQTWWFNALSVLIIGTAGYFIYNFRINQLMKLERMRQRISADLHDDIGASLTTINVLSKMVSSHDMEKSVLNKYLGQISDQAGHVTESLRDIVWSIQPQNDKLQNLLDRMKKFAGQILESKNINYNFNISGIHSKEQVLDIETRQNVYLIFKEILNNIVKHSQATETSIVMSSTPKSLQIEIKDNGIGLDDSTITKGNGLNNMKQRAEKLKGTIKIGPFDSKGTAILCTIPINIT
jgi:signal transduction histidine kinase